MSRRWKKVDLIDLFSGCGGFSFGFLQGISKLRIKIAIDHDYRALETYRANIPVEEVIQSDIQELHSLEILELLNGKSPDIVIASPPCESFSAANPDRKQSAYDQLYSDEGGRLMLHAIRIISDLSPSFFIIENVSRIASREMQSLIRHEFGHSDYEIFFNVLEAVEFGIPSYRRRAFISNVSLSPPSPKRNSNVSTVNNAFSCLPQSTGRIPNHDFVPPSPSLERKIPKTPPGGALVYFRGSQDRNYLRNYIRLLLDQPSPTVMGKSRFIHPFLPRLCTVREHARLMSYPDDFRFYGNLDSCFNQVGESVPPHLSKAIAEQLFNVETQTVRRNKGCS
ncbi:MAG: DNA cytosine methyltransferase [Candidatus Heimdallarchaeota archaeon]